MNTPLTPETTPHLVRAFVSVAINDVVRAGITAVQSSLEQVGADIKWVAPGNIHLTLLFLGMVFESQVAALTTAIDEIAATYQPGKLAVKGLGFFGRPQSPKIIWAGLSGDLRALLDLQVEIAGAAENNGIYTDTRPFNPHLTIGRFRSTRRANDILRVLAQHQDKDFGVIEVESVDLIRSDLAPAGPLYTRLHSSRLSATVFPEHPGEAENRRAEDQAP